MLSDTARARRREILDHHQTLDTDGLRVALSAHTAENRAIHEKRCINLNPATNVMSPRAEAALATGLGTRPSLGHAGEKYEMGLDAIEQIEVVTADLACRVFEASHAEIRVLSGAMANLMAFMALCKPGDTIIVPPPSIGGHVTHNQAGAAGLFGLDIIEAPIDADRYTVDVGALADIADEVKPRLITIGASLNLLPHPVAELRAVADNVGAHLLFDAAHACGMFSGRRWPNPLSEGAHLMTMSTYKSLAGPAGGLVVTNDDDIAGRLDSIAYPGLTANNDAGRIAALGYTLLDWLDHGDDHGAAMVEAASALAIALRSKDIDVFTTVKGPTRSHQFALPADDGHATALRLAQAGLLSCAIGLPTGDGLRLGVNEAVRWGMTSTDMFDVAGFIARALRDDPALVAGEVADFRARFDTVRFCS